MKEEGITALSLIPGRQEPSDRSEMVTQLLFGERFYITEKKPDWVKIKIHFDEYECWVASKQIHILLNKPNKPEQEPVFFSDEIFYSAYTREY